ncbi:putative methyl-accepting chemotaxis protein McpB [Desulforapulum autotrophicum HRM2]|uniref:Methyl-accepting chemotaxis protein McpB n=2 Tax=Desulforapulum autotrophicum TaxID=2296 RepID=C0QCW4_DESAH|nr:putative methyl-accepting chemotaxis protein McpB [Desulforapulum autotrophicum HRM2]
MIKSIAGNADSLGTSANSLVSLSQSISSGSDNMSERSCSVAAAAEEMSANMNSVAAANVNMVASAMEEMNATVREQSKRRRSSKTRPPAPEAGRPIQGVMAAPLWTRLAGSFIIKTGSSVSPGWIFPWMPCGIWF